MSSVKYQHFYSISVRFHYVKVKNLQHNVLNATAVKLKVPQYVGHMSQEEICATKFWWGNLFECDNMEGHGDGWI